MKLPNINKVINKCLYTFQNGQRFCKDQHVFECIFFVLAHTTLLCQETSPLCDGFVKINHLRLLISKHLSASILVRNY